MATATETSQTSMYQGRGPLAGLSGRKRLQLMMLHRAFRGPFDALQAASVLNIEVHRTRRLLAALAHGGWLSRVRQGWYIAVPMDASVPGEWREDPWVVAATLFSPSYIGGWSAAEHWGLTDQIFNVVYVVAGRKLAPTCQTVQGNEYLIRTVPVRALFGTRRVWRKNVPVDVSDPHRTIIDILDFPASAGGVLHAHEVLLAYFESEHADQATLLSYGDRLGRGTVFKRLGYLTERARIADAGFIEACHSSITKGVSRLDPSGPPKGRIISKWNLRVNSPSLDPDNVDST